MAISEFAFDPADGFENTTSFPEPGPDEARAQVQELHNQTKTKVNEVITQVNTNTSDISDLVAQTVPDGTVTTPKLADGAVTADKVADDVATQARLDNLAGDGRTTETVKGTTDALVLHVNDDANPHGVNKTQVGLANVTNDAQVPLSTVTTAWDIIVATGAGAVGRLALGAADKLLKVNAAGTALEYGVGVQVASGTWNDAATSIAASATYTKTIPLGFAATKGKVTLINGALTGAFLTIFTDSANSVAVVLSGGGNATLGFGNTELGSNLVAYGTNIYLRSAYIDGSNLKLLFENTDLSNSQTLDIIHAVWEVEG